MYPTFWHCPQKLLSSTKLTKLQNCANESECCKLIHYYWTPFMATLWYLQLMDHRLDMPDKILLYYFNSNTTMIIFIHSLLVKFTSAQWKQSFHGWMLFVLYGIIQMWRRRAGQLYWAYSTGFLLLVLLFSLFSKSTWALLQHSDLREVRGHVTWWVDFPGEGRK